MRWRAYTMKLVTDGDGAGGMVVEKGGIFE